jgi:hypothetical protein
MIIPLLVDDVSGKSYLLDEIDQDDYIPRIMGIRSKEIKKKDREIWDTLIGEKELDLEEMYEKREKHLKSLASTSVSASATSTSTSITP